MAAQPVAVALRRLIAAFFFFALTSSAHAQSLDKAKLLYANKLYDEAKKELVAVAVSEAPVQDRAAALNLLGSIAVEEERYDAAVSNWEQLIAKYPDSPEAHEAQGKLPLARKLLGAGRTTPAPAAPKPLAPDTVLIAGSAPEAPEFADQAVLEFMNLLSSNGVRVKNASIERGSDAGGRALRGRCRTCFSRTLRRRGPRGFSMSSSTSAAWRTCASSATPPMAASCGRRRSPPR